MFGFETEKFIIRLLDKSNKDELTEVQKLRYQSLLKDFNHDLPSEGIDDDGYDEYSDSIIAVDKSNGVIAGTYRIATVNTVKGHEFMSGEEFDLSPLINCQDGFIEAGRAVVKEEYRDGNVLSLLWAALFNYGEVFNLRYVIGTVSFHGTDPQVHEKCTSLLRNEFVSNEFKVRSRKNSFEYGEMNNLSRSEVEIPALLKGYLYILGGKVSENGYIDYKFNSCDVLMIVDLHKVNPRHVQMLFRGL